MSRTLLCVDDDPRTLTLYRMVLEDHGYKTLVESNGWDGLNASDRYPVDCILVDYQMPGMNGAEFVRRLKCKHASTPVIVVSGSQDVPAELLSQVAAFIEKPFRVKNLVECVESVTNEGRRDCPAGHS